MPYAIINGMMITIDSSGRIVLPKSLRQRLGLETGAELSLIEQPEGLLLRPLEKPSAMEKRDGIWTHKGMACAGLRWDRLTDDAREERLHSFLKI